ncbi:MAG: ATP-binding protein [Pseudomonadota bacterium]|nr:ATP-binding protein [Pseudomonadota bacterium]
MEKQQIKELIVEHKARFLGRHDLVRRSVQAEVARYLLQREIVVITGIRRSGKSSLLRLICEDLITRDAAVPATPFAPVPPANILYLNFDDERFISFTVQDFASLYETFIELENPQGRHFLFLDEIQRIPGWERWLSRLYEFEDIRIFVTGSNTAILSPEVATTLTGRHRQITVRPFSFREFLSLRGVSIAGPERARELYLPETRAEIRRHLVDYVEIGGFPEVVRTGDATLLEQYWRDILYRDVIARHGIKNIREIKELSLFLAAHPGAVQSYRNLGNLIGVRSVNTVKNYLNALADVYLFQFIDLFDYSLKRQIYNPSKVYCADTALGGAVSFRFSRNLGHIYENMVFLELQRRGNEVFYWRSTRGREVDFVVKTGLRITEAIQVCSSLADPRTREREFRALRKAAELLKAERLTIITDDEEGYERSNFGDIDIVPLWKWLL